MTEQSSHTIRISDSAYIYGVALERRLTVSPQTPYTLTTSGGGTRWGDYDPTFSNVEQDSWLDGIGHEFRDIRRSGCFDSRNAWTLTSEYILPSMMWRWATGDYIETYEHLPHGRDMDWQGAYGTTRYISADFTIGGSAYDSGKVYIWIRRKGSPADATLAIYTDSGDDPDSLVTSTNVTIDTDNITDFTSEWFGIDVSAASNLTASTKYHVVFDGGDNSEASHWQIGVNEAGTSSKYSTAASSWTTASYTMYHRVIPTPIKRKWLDFTLEGADYWIDVRDDGGTSVLLINGDRGIATSATATSITDTAKSWTADEWIGAWVRITKGTGKGQYKQITDNTTTALTIGTLDITPDATSEYVIYACDQVNAITTTGITTVKDVAVLNNIAYFAQGSGDALVRMRWNSATPGYDWADVANSAKADVLFVDNDIVDGAILWRGENDTVDVSRSTAATWGSDNAYGTEIPIGGDDYEILDIVKYDKNIYVMKENHPYKIVNDRAEPFLSDQLGFSPSEFQGIGAVGLDVFFYIPWNGWSLQEYFGTSLTDVSYKGFTSDRVGNYSFLVPHPAGLVCGIDAGDGSSSIMIRHNGRSSWHEVFRGYEAGARIRNGAWQDNAGDRPRLWFSINGELMSMKFPRMFNPVKDTSLEYHHEAVVEYSKIDMNAGSLYKYFKDQTLRSRNLTEEIYIDLDYKVDSDIESSAEWINVGKYAQSPRETLDIRRGEITKIQPRLRLHTNLRTTPPTVESYNLKGFSRTPLKWNYQVMAKTEPLGIDKLGNPDHEPDDLITFLKHAATKAKILTMYSDYPFANEIPVVVEPYTLKPDEPDIEGNWSGVISFTVRDA